MISWEDCLRRPSHIDRTLLVATLHENIETCFPKNHRFDQMKEQEDKFRLYTLICRMLVSQYGPWIEHWSDSAGDGGFVQSWCCPSHSILPGPDRTLKGTLGRVADAVVEWHQLLQEFEDLFATLASKSEHKPLSERAEQAAVEIVNKTLEINSGDDAWFHAFATLFHWYLQSLGVNTIVIEGYLEEVIEGRFESWVGPSDEVRTQAAREIGEVFVKQRELIDQSSEETVDATERWLRSRDRSLFYGTAFKPSVQVREDKHRQFIQEFDGERSQERAEAMLSALHCCRQDATTDRPLNWEMLVRWQSIVLGRNADFRTGDAFAKGGRDRYPLLPKTPKQFKTYLEEANDSELCPLRVAARVYKDICCFHPFEDGNARAARLALEFVLARNDLALVLVDPVFRLSRPSDGYALEGTLRCVVGTREF